MEWTEMILPLASGFAIVTATMPLFIGYFQMKKYGQEIRGDGPKWHNVKAGTPTMGGFVFLISAMITAIWVGAWQNQLTASLFILLFITLVYGALGFLDDFIKIFRKRNMGLNSLQKLIGQILGGLVFLWLVRHFLACWFFKCSQLDGRYRWASRRTGHDFFFNLRTDCLATRSNRCVNRLSCDHRRIDRLLSLQSQTGKNLYGGCRLTGFRRSAGSYLDSFTPRMDPIACRTGLCL